MNTVSQTIAKLVILPLFGGAVITGVALATVDSAAAATEWVPPAPAASTAPARPDLIENEISVDAVAAAPAAAAPAAAAPAAAAPAAAAPAAAAPAHNATSGKQDSGPADKNKKDNAKSSKGSSARQ